MTAYKLSPATSCLMLTALLTCCTLNVALAAPPQPDSAYAQAYLAREFTQALIKAKRGEVAAQDEVGRSYQMGVGVPRDTKLAQRWLRRAVAGGSIDAVVARGESFEFGWGVDRNANRARDDYTTAAEQRSVRGFYALGALYLKGGGPIKPDGSEAFKWFSLAAAHGHYRAGDDKQSAADALTPLALEYAGYRANHWERLQQGREAVVVARREVHIQSSQFVPYAYQLVDVYQVANRTKFKP